MDPRNDVVPFNDIRVREAMQLAINLPLLASSYYSDATSPLPLELTAYAETGWAWPYDQWPQELKDQYAYNPTGAKALLTAAGYPNGINTNIVVDSGADQDFVLVIQSFLKAVNINMQIIVMDTSSWNNYVSVNKKQDQMAMRGGGSLALQYEPLRQLSRLQTGYSTNYARVNDPVLDAFYPAFVACTSVAQEKAILRDANERVLRQHYVLSFVESVSFSFYQPWLKGYNGQYGALGSLTCSYLARFWLDQNLKTSLGH
jgi:ABC-type transport system substrate-binding protein